MKTLRNIIAFAVSVEHCIDRIMDHRGKTPTKLGGVWSTSDDALMAPSAMPLLQTIKVLDAQTQALTTMRDWLLPMLMNGQVTVK